MEEYKLVFFCINFILTYLLLLIFFFKFNKLDSVVKYNIFFKADYTLKSSYNILFITYHTNYQITQIIIKYERISEKINYSWIAVNNFFIFFLGGGD